MTIYKDYKLPGYIQSNILLQTLDICIAIQPHQIASAEKYLNLRCVTRVAVWDVVAGTINRNTIVDISELNNFVISGKWRRL